MNGSERNQRKLSQTIASTVKRRNQPNTTNKTQTKQEGDDGCTHLADFEAGVWGSEADGLVGEGGVEVRRVVIRSNPAHNHTATQPHINDADTNETQGTGL